MDKKDIQYFTRVEVPFSVDGDGELTRKAIYVRKGWTAVYGNILLLTLRMDKGSMVVFHYLCGQMGRSNVVRFRGGDIKEMLDKCGALGWKDYMKEGSVMNCVKKLKSANVLVRVSNGVMMVNPIFACNVRGKSRIFLIKKFFELCVQAGKPIKLIYDRTEF